MIADWEWEGRCHKPFTYLGDIATCWSPKDHRGTCDEAAAVRQKFREEGFNLAERLFTAWLAGDI